jgi:hypothetical protein
MKKMENIQSSTPNAEHPMNDGRSRAGHNSMLDFRFNPGVKP